MSESTERFSNRVENYVKYRPGYPAELLNFFCDEIGLNERSIIADIGSGTGISSKIFLENGNEVYGIEPNAAMREASKVFLKDFPKFRAIDGTAEDTTLAAKSVDFVVAAQAFHWFDRAKTRDEFRHILRENCYIALIWNERQLDSNDFLREYERFVLEFGTDYSEIRHENITNEAIRDFFQREFHEKTFRNSQKLNFAGLKGRILSSSYIPNEENPRFSRMIEELNYLFANHQKDDTIEIIYDTKVFYARF